MKTKDEIMDDLLLQLPETYNNAIEVIAEKTLEIEELKYQLNNSEMFHCPQFLTNDSGGISCHKDFQKEIQQLQEQYDELICVSLRQEEQLKETVELMIELYGTFEDVHDYEPVSQFLAKIKKDL